MRITDAAETWSDPVTPAEDEVWQCLSGALLITAEAAPAPEDGLRLDYLGAVPIRAGRTVRYRRLGSTPVILAREAL